jgi:uridine kinase
MIGDKIRLKPAYIKLAQDILVKVLPSLINEESKYFITIGGESGCGKSTLAFALKHCFEMKHIPTYIFHMDDYFKLPPKSNHLKREEDISWVGPSEVRLDLLQETMHQIKLHDTTLNKPLVDYANDSIEEETFDSSNYKVFIVEGTYTSLLEDINLKIFIDRSYKDTLQQRIDRARDPITPFVEEVLEIEHKIISSHKPMANLIIDKNYQPHFV